MSDYLNTLFGLHGRIAVVTGATRGLGQTMALALAKAGADMVLLQRDMKNMETAQQIEALGRKCHVVECDLAKRDQVKNMAAKITSEMGLTVDILVNCGGIQRRHAAEDFPEQDWDDVLEVQLNSAWILSQSIGKHMLETRQGRPRGKIINIASVLSFQGGYQTPAYTAAKHAAVGMTKALSNEWGGKGVNVNGLAPGYVKTDLIEALVRDETRTRQIMERVPMTRWGSPHDFEGAIIYLASSASDFVSGETLVVDGGWMGR